MNFVVVIKKNMVAFFVGFFGWKSSGKKSVCFGLMEKMCVCVCCLGVFEGVGSCEFSFLPRVQDFFHQQYFTKKWMKLLSTKLPSLKLTCSHPKMDGWNTFSFPFRAKGLFSGANLLLVLGRVLF